MERNEQSPRTEGQDAARAGPSLGARRYQIQVRATFVRLSRPSAAAAS